MELKYFSLTDDKETLKKKWKKLALEYHPDKNLHNVDESTKIMQDINNELAYCIKFGGGFDLSKINLNSISDVTELIKHVMNDMVNEVIASEQRYSIKKFYTQMRDCVKDLSKPRQIIKVVKEEKQ